MARIKLIVNPTAGKGYAAKAAADVERTLDSLHLEHETVFTKRPLHAVELARQAAEDRFDIVAAMGGDGTANEVLNGLMQAAEAGHTHTALALLGAGRGNDFAFGAGLPDSLAADCLLLKEGRRCPFDVGKVWVDGAESGRFFGNGIGIGFDAVVGFEAAKMRLSGFAAYLAAALKTLFLYFKPPHVTISLDGVTLSQPALMISLMNGKRMGGGFMMAPDGESDDGLLDYCIVSYGKKLRLLALMLKFMKGTQIGEKEIRSGRARRIDITAEKGSLPAHADGETLCETGKHLRVEIIPAGLQIIAPENKP